MPGRHLGAVTPDAVAAASARWTWYPSDAETRECERLLLVRWPAYFDSAPGLIRFASTAPVRATLDEAVDQARAWGAGGLVVWVKLDAPQGLEDELISRGARLDETLDVFALDLARRPELDVPDDLVVRWQVDEPTTRDAIEVGIAAFGEGTMPDTERVAALAAEAADDLRAGRGGCVIAYDGEIPVGSGGLTLDGSVARLWGGGVVPSARGRGAYRSVLAARLVRAVDLGATTALVKGRIETSGPILRRAGFEVFGQERSYLLSCGEPEASDPPPR